MSQKHFNRSLSQSRTVQIIASVKWRIRVKTYFLSEKGTTMTNGGGRGREWHGKGEAIVIRRSDIEGVHDFARVHCKLRDFLLIRVPMKIGLRVTELCTLNIEDIDFDSFSFQVLDSKKKRFYPLPLDGITLQLIKDLIGSRREGNVFVREDNWKTARQNKPLSRTAIWYLIHGIGVKAGIENLSPRVLRHYFSAHWFIVEKKSVEGLRRILRHKNLATTSVYLSRLVFFEDLQIEYQKTQEPYIQTREVSQFYRDHCSHCMFEETCRYVDQVSSSPWASGCRFYKQKKEEWQKNVE